MRIGIVAGEASGDYLAAGLVRALKEKVPDVDIEGIGGPMMKREGVRINYPMDTISVMGVDGLAKSLWNILQIRKSTYLRFVKQPPDVFVGVDVPDFNLGLEHRLKHAGIPTVHYVSPTVWAWREYRVKKIRRSVDLMLALFPFEADYYYERNVPVVFVGHPLADEVPEDVDREAARATLGVDSKFVVALLPGSRISEVKRLGQMFIDVAVKLHASGKRNVQFLAPFVSTETLEHFRNLLTENAPELPLRLFEGQSRQVLASSDLALLASGTAALEAALHKVPMVVTYKVSWFTGLMVRMFARVRYFSMPNNLLEKPVVPELMQNEATVEPVWSEMDKYLSNEELRREVERTLGRIPRMLRCGANVRAAEEVLQMAARTSSSV
ncbi:MAG: Lipid-A-disaccharide synthase [Gammaproteobacteria bacterium]|nr:Lipid-A-disaccharide synthase [Gammaproteobacteria bacterium]